MAVAMSEALHAQPALLPTLTEVLELRPPRSPEALALSAEVLFELEQHVSDRLEARLHAALGPVLARAAEAMLVEARQELARSLRVMVDDAVTRALERRTGL
jgi:hypothetical protein